MSERPSEARRHGAGDAARAGSNDRFRGCLVGLAVGDAVGTTVEFHPRGSFTPVTDMTGAGPFGLRAGQWTDDTSMALCLAESLIEKGFDLADQIERYCRWFETGYWSSTERCFDIGNATRAALRRYRCTGEPAAGSVDPYSAGNGCIMRLAPVPMYSRGQFVPAFGRTGNHAAHALGECDTHALRARSQAAREGSPNSRAPQSGVMSGRLGSGHEGWG